MSGGLMFASLRRIVSCI